jgi:hypothetical protein
MGEGITLDRLTRSAGAIVFAAVLLVGLNGCATSANPGAMTLAAQPAAGNEKPFPQILQHAMCVRAVTGGTKTNPMWVSKVDDEGFKSALSSSLDTAGLAAPADKCAYPIDVNLLGLSQPAFGFNMTVTSHVNYKVYDVSGQPFLLATIDAPYTAKAGDAFMGVKRLRLANEGSIRASIQKFFDKLREVEPK